MQLVEVPELTEKDLKPITLGQPRFVIPPGSVLPPPEDSQWSALFQRLTAGEPIAAGKWIYQDPTTKLAMLADSATSDATAECLGVAINTAATGQPVNFVGGDAIDSMELDVGYGLVQTGVAYTLSNVRGDMIAYSAMTTAYGQRVTICCYGTSDHTIKLCTRPTHIVIPWTPASVGASLAAWYDLADSTTLFQDSALTIPCAANLDPLGGWKDKSSGAHHATQGSSSQKPIYYTNSGKPYIRGDGVDDRLTMASPFALTGPFTIAYVCHRQVSTDFVLFHGVSVSDSFVMHQSNGSFAVSPDDNTKAVSLLIPITTRDMIVRVSRDASNVVKLLYTGGTEVTIGTMTGTYTATFNLILYRVYGGTATANVNWLSEIIASNSIIADNLLSGYFQPKWGLTLP